MVKVNGSIKSTVSDRTGDGASFTSAWMLVHMKSLQSSYDVGDISEIPHLLDQIGVEVASMTADGAYDDEAVYNAVAERHPEAAVIIPPRVTAVTGGTTPIQRDLHIATIAKHGRMGWQRRSGYNRRSLIETAMFRYKTIIGRRLHARTLTNQRTEAKIGCNALNRMTALGMPASARVR